MNLIPATIYLWRNDQVEGPLVTAEVAESLRSGATTCDVPFVFDRTEQWRPLKEIELLLIKLAVTTAASRQLSVDYSCNQCGGKITELGGSSRPQSVICPHCGHQTFLTVPWIPAHAQMVAPIVRIIHPSSVHTAPTSGTPSRPPPPPATSAHTAPTGGEPSSSDSMGAVCIILGLVITGYFFLFFDVSVPGPHGAIANVDKLNTRQNGVIIGMGLLILGAILRLKSSK